MAKRTKHYQKTCVDGELRDVHRAVMEAHLGRRLSPKEVVHHINGDIHDNRIHNLELLSLEEHGRLHHRGRSLPKTHRLRISATMKAFGPKGSKNGCAKLTEGLAAEIKRRLVCGETPYRIARDFPVSTKVICQIRNNEVWTHVPWPGVVCPVPAKEGGATHEE